MVEDEQADVVVKAPPPERKSRKLLLGTIGVLLALGAGYYVWHTRQSAQETAKGAAPAVSRVELYLPLEPVFVVNFRDEDSLRYLQVGVTLMSHDGDAISVSKGADPVIRDALISLFSDQDYSIISDVDGRQKLQGQALAAVQKIVKERLGRPGIDALYFTSFVMQ